MTTEKKTKTKDQISDDQLKPRQETQDAPGSTAAGSAWAREDI
jgi:hypothetical protein